MSNNKIIYMKTGQARTTIAAGLNAGDFEEYGVSNIDVMKWCLGLRETPIQTHDGTTVVFELKNL